MARIVWAVLACSFANPWCTWIEADKPGKSVEFKEPRIKLPSVRSAKILDGFVPWWATMTEFKVGSHPTYQNWTADPSPPEA